MSGIHDINVIFQLVGLFPPCVYYNFFFSELGSPPTQPQPKLDKNIIFSLFSLHYKLLSDVFSIFVSHQFDHVCILFSGILAKFPTSKGFRHLSGFFMNM